MRLPTDLFPYQGRATEFQCAHPHSAMWMDMGLGKTIVTLTSIAYLLGIGALNGVIIVAPIRVCRLVWRQEAMKWAHTRHLTFTSLLGSKDQRVRNLTHTKADIYLINYENLEWLTEAIQTYFLSRGKPLPANGIVYDEISKCKNSSTNRVKALKKILPYFIWRTGLTGTPASNGYKDLHGQYLVLDEGKRLGTSKTQFETRWYKKEGAYKKMPYEDTGENIKQLIGDMTLEMSAADYNPLPDLIVNDITVELPPDLREKYEAMEREFFIKLESGAEVEMFNTASMMNKCLAEGTEILTYEGWKRIETLTRKDCVWDGVEWVSIDGVVYNGHVPTVECWGVSMTPDHKVLTVEGWKEAQEILNEQSSKRHDRAAVRTPFSAYERGEPDNCWDISAGVVESTMRLRKRDCCFRSGSSQSEQTEAEVLRLSSWGNYSNPQHDKNSPMDYLEKHALPLQFSVGQGLGKLRRAWDKGVSKLGQFIHGFLGRHGAVLSESPHIGTEEREQGLLEKKLSVGRPSATGEQHPQQRVDSDTNWENNSRSSCQKIRAEPDHHLQTDSERMGGSRPDKANVFDIINAGPRHRFTVRGKNQEVFLAHNCLQFSNGAMYPIAGMPMWEPIHDLKLDALEDILEEAGGRPVLCSYAYVSDAERIMRRFGQSHHAINLTECKSEKALKQAMSAWITGRCKLMIGHPASMGHGIDGLQEAGNILVWYGLNWSLDLFVQFNARLRRQGQGAPVICHRILCAATLDQAQALALESKATTEAALRAAVKQYHASKK